MDHQTNQEHQPVDPKQAEFIVGAVVGAMAGAAAALLLTPKNGQEMRHLVKQYAKEWETEAYQLAKEAKGVSKSLHQALNEGAAGLVEAAPQKIGEATHQAQHLASTIEQHIETARETVSEIAEAFRSGWEEYGEEIVPANQLEAKADSNKLDSNKLDSSKLEVPDVLMIREIEDEEDSPEDHRPAPVSVHSTRRRSHSHHYAMHSQTATEEAIEEVAKEEPQEESTARPMLASEEIAEAPKAPVTAHYTTRILEEATPVVKEDKMDAQDSDKSTKHFSDKAKDKETKAEAKSKPKAADAEDKGRKEDKDAKSTKKLFFRRGS